MTGARWSRSELSDRELRATGQPRRMLDGVEVDGSTGKESGAQSRNNPRPHHDRDLRTRAEILRGVSRCRRVTQYSVKGYARPYQTPPQASCKAAMAGGAYA
jgi:hypothetical protein